MHELSIAQSLFEQVRRHTPPGHHALIARVEAGPFQAIDPQALEWAWQATVAGSELAETRLEYRALPFDLACARCGRKWTSRDPFERCTCGADPEPAGSSDLRLISLEVELLSELIPTGL